MDANETRLKCLNCGNSEMEIPLISARYAGESLLICSRCLPILIHKPEQLTGTLEGADKIPPAAHHH
jgi:hypothetical protein